MIPASFFYPPPYFKIFGFPPLFCFPPAIWELCCSLIVNIKLPEIKFEILKTWKYNLETAWKMELYWKVSLVQEDLLIVLLKQVLHKITLRSVKFPQSKFQKVMVSPLFIFPHQISKFYFPPYLKKGAKSESPFINVFYFSRFCTALKNWLDISECFFDLKIPPPISNFFWKIQFPTK